MEVLTKSYLPYNISQVGQSIWKRGYLFVKKCLTPKGQRGFTQRFLRGVT